MNDLRVASFGNRDKRDVALTFDDGPNPYATLKILDLLDSFGVKATFFVVGRRCAEFPEILREIARRGHLIGNHTFSHGKGDFEKCDIEISRIVGKKSGYVRPPFYDVSFCDEEKAYLRNALIIMGDVDSRDYLDISAQEVTDTVLAQVRAGSIIDFHDGSENDADLETRAQKTIGALPSIITRLHDQFALVRIDEMDLQFTPPETLQR